MSYAANYPLKGQLKKLTRRQNSPSYLINKICFFYLLQQVGSAEI